MAGRGPRARPPFWAAWRLARLAGFLLPYLRGRLILAGVDIEDLSVSELLDVTEAAVWEKGELLQAKGGYADWWKAITESPLKDDWGLSARSVDAAKAWENLVPASPPASPDE